MNLKTVQLLVLMLMIVGLFVLILKYESANALQPEAKIPGVCDKYNIIDREYEVCRMVQGAPCLVLWGMWLMTSGETKDVQKIIAEKYVKRGCLYGAY